MTIRALCFDLDDTLYGYAPCNEVGLRAAHGVLWSVTAVSFDEYRGVHDAVRSELAEELAGQAASHNRAIFFKRIVERLVGPGRGGVAVQLFDEYWRAFLAAMRPAPEAREILASLANTYSLALISNHTTDIQLRKLRALGLEELFPVVATSEEAGVEKPDPRIFEFALAALAVAPEQALMIGDNPTVDLAGARSAGLGGVLSREFVSPNMDDGEHVVTIASLRELPTVLGRS